MLGVGTRAPLFVSLSTSGEGVSLLGLRGTKVILYFFHNALTSAALASAALTSDRAVETRGLRDHYPDLRTHGVQVIGVSTDTLSAQSKFAAKHLVTFPMIGDEEGVISRAYDALAPVPFVKASRRVTYAIDEGGVITAVFHHEFQASRHLEEVLRYVRGWTAPSGRWPTSSPLGREATSVKR